MNIRKRFHEFLYDPDPTDYHGDIKLSITFVSVMMAITIMGFFIMVAIR